MAIFESGEMYLETILKLKRSSVPVRSVDLVNEMNFAKSTVSEAVKQLSANGYITVDGSGFISLTDAGQKVAESIYERHLILTEALKYLGVSGEVAEKDACKIEHDLSSETFDKIKAYVENAKKK